MKKVIIGSLLGSAMSFASASAFSGIIAYSTLEVSNLSIVDGIDLINLSTVEFTNTGGANAGFNGAGPATGIVGSPPTQTIAQACLGANNACDSIAEDTFSRVSSSVVDGFARGDASVAGNILLGTAGATTVAETSIGQDGLGVSSSFGGGNTGVNGEFMTLSFDLNPNTNAGGPIVIEFDYEGMLYVESDDPTGNVSASYNWGVTTTNAALQNFGALPDLLNEEISIIGVGGPTTAGTGGVQTATLAFDVNPALAAEVGKVTLTISHGSRVDASVAVPAPATLSILGLGLLGVAGAAKRRRRS